MLVLHFCFYSSSWTSGWDECHVRNVWCDVKYTCQICPEEAHNRVTAPCYCHCVLVCWKKAIYMHLTACLLGAILNNGPIWDCTCFFTHSQICCMWKKLLITTQNSNAKPKYYNQETPVNTECVYYNRWSKCDSTEELSRLDSTEWIFWGQSAFGTAAAEKSPAEPRHWWWWLMTRWDQLGWCCKGWWWWGGGGARKTSAWAK